MSDNEEEDMFSNPLLPPEEQYDEEEEEIEMVSHQPLTNADFRKLLMTPRTPAEPLGKQAAKKQVSVEAETDAGNKRKQKKLLYAKMKKVEEEEQKELAEKYRDRAQERREGLNKDYDDSKVFSTTADYRAVAPDAKSEATLAERRKQLIQESKYLGGDMEHTHLVKGLDYALLEKVRAEITSKEQEDDTLEGMVEAREEEKPEPKLEFKTKLGRSIYRTLFKTRLPERNELFMPGRMAYVIDLEDEDADTDVPVTFIRSKADCAHIEASTTLSTNDIVINKLTQILSYLRQGRRDKRKKLKDKDKGKLKDDDKSKVQDDGIYVEADLELGKPKKESERERDHRERRERGRDHRDRDRHDRDRRREHREDRDRDHGHGKRSYFEKPAEEDEDHTHRAVVAPAQSASELVRNINEKYGGHDSWTSGGQMKEESDPRKKAATEEDSRLAKLKKKVEVDSYAECYPGYAEADDAIIESDDEADYTKMDPGNKKGPVSRWDFDTQEEYSDYMSNKEALPKAAFQYGVKMADGRKTRRGGPKDEKKELDREWQKIQNIIQKRKHMATDGDASADKRIRY